MNSPLETLKALLLDPEGNISFRGSNEDCILLKQALDALQRRDERLHRVADLVAATLKPEGEHGPLVKLAEHTRAQFAALQSREARFKSALKQIANDCTCPHAMTIARDALNT